MSIKYVIKSIFERTEIIFISAIVLPLIFIINVNFIKSWIEIILGIVMFLSIRPFFRQKSELDTRNKNTRGIIISLLLNYVLLSGMYLLAALLFFPIMSDYFIGYLLLAIVPPAVSIVPLCYLTKCDINVADKALIIGYFLALFIIPVTLYFVFGANLNFMLLARSLIILILLPLFLAYISKNINTTITNKIFSYTKIMTNILIGVVIFIVVSLNRSTLLNVKDINVLHIFMINIFIVFALGLIVYFVSKKFVQKMDAIDYSLYVTQKNEATGLAIALLMFTSITAIPLIIALVVQFVYFIVFERFVISV